MAASTRAACPPRPPVQPQEKEGHPCLHRRPARSQENARRLPCAPSAHGGSCGGISACGTDLSHSQRVGKAKTQRLVQIFRCRHRHGKDMLCLPLSLAANSAQTLLPSTNCALVAPAGRSGGSPHSEVRQACRHVAKSLQQRPLMLHLLHHVAAHPATHADRRH